MLMTVPAASGAGDDNPAELLLADFTQTAPGPDWYVQNDNVMGGRSQGGFEITDGQLVFTGNTNTNGGGFSSIRTAPFKLDLSGYTRIRLHVKGDGRRYTWQLQSTGRYRGFEISYWADFETVAGEWTWVDLPFSAFAPNIRGYPLDGPPLPVQDIAEFGLYIYDKLDGPFELRLDRIAAGAE
jgi:monofunctional biosynthetic peptidoglycan transglycosylase